MDFQNPQETAPAAGDRRSPYDVDLLVAGLGPGGTAAALAAHAAGLRTLAVEARGRHGTRAQLVLVRHGARQALNSIGLSDVTQGRRSTTIRHVEAQLRDALEAAAQAAMTSESVLEVEWNCGVVGLQADDEGVSVTLRDALSGEVRQLRARHVIDATGGRLEALGRPARVRHGATHWVIFSEFLTPPWFDGVAGATEHGSREMVLLYPTWQRQSVVCGLDTPPGREWDGPALVQRFEHIAELLQLGPPRNPPVAVDVYLRRLARPTRDRVVPIGDSVGTIEVLLGAGMSMAIEDGVMAARSLAQAQRAPQPAAEMAITRRLAKRLYRRHRIGIFFSRALLTVRPLIRRVWPTAELDTLRRDQVAPPPLLWTLVRLLFGRRPSAKPR